jgi:serine/threonine protein kinase
MRSVADDGGSAEVVKRSGVRCARHWEADSPTRRLSHHEASGTPAASERRLRLPSSPPPRTAPSCTAEPGEVIDGRYLLERIAGRGGMGVVWRALELATGRPVALKLHNRRHSERLRLVQEAYLLSSIRHEALVGYLGHGDLAASPYLAMEWLDGEDLGERLARRPLSVADTVTLGRRMAGALAAVHARSVVHCDVKPANVFLPAGVAADAKLLDFGVARVAGRGFGPGTQSMVGTPGYMAPEQITAEGDVDARADLFSLGAVLHECLAGHGPFAARRAMEALRRTMQELPPPLSSLRADVPPALVDLISALLCRSPDRRPQTAAWVVARFDAIAADVDQKRGLPRSLDQERDLLRSLDAREALPLLAAG